MIRLSRSTLAALACLATLTSGAALTRAQPAPAPVAPVAPVVPGGPSPAPTGSAPAAGATTGAPVAGAPAAGPAPMTAPPGVPPGAYVIVPQGGGSAYAYYVPAPTAPTAPAGPPVRTAGAWVHDGFYLTLTPGAILHRGHLSVPGLASDTSTRGTGLGFDFALGGSISRHLVLGAMLSRHSPDVDLTTNGGSKPVCGSGTQTTSTSLSCSTAYSYTALSLLVVYYPDRTRGWNVQAALGLGSLSFKNLTIKDVPTDTGRQTLTVGDLEGVHAMIGVGHEFFIGPDWSIGPLLRLEAGQLRQSDEPRARATFFTPSLRLAFTYH